MSLFSKIKTKAVGAKDKLKAAGADIFDQTQMKLSGKQFRVNGRKYKPKKLLGEGGFGFVYLVEDEQTGQLRALKHMIMQTKEAKESTMREINLYLSLPRSPYIVQCIDAETLGDEAFVVMELCGVGGNLADILNAAGPGGKGMPESKIWDAFYQVCQAVLVLHEMDPIIIHRDIKAENVLIAEDGTYKLCDFGSAKREMVFATNEMVRGQIAEDIDRNTTLVYRSPEMVDLYQEKWIGDKVDIWALGCLLWKMAYIVTPFEDQGRLGILNCKLEFPNNMNASSYSDQFRNTVTWLLTPDPDLRPNILEVLERVAQIKGTTFPKKGHKAPTPPSYPPGFGPSASTSKGPAHSSNSAKSVNILDSLDWQGSSGGSSHSHNASSSNALSNDEFLQRSDNLFASVSLAPSFGDPNMFFPDSASKLGEPSWDPFAPTPNANHPSSARAFSAFESSNTSPPQSITQTSSDPSFVTTPSTFFDQSSSPEPVQRTSPYPPLVSLTSSIGGTSIDIKGTESAPKGHRRSVSDSSAITAGLAFSNTKSEGSTSSVIIPSADVNRIPQLVSELLEGSEAPSNTAMRELLIMTWSSPQQVHVSKTFQTLAPKLAESPQNCIKGLYMIHRLICEGSDCVLTLCNNKIEFFKKLLTQLEEQTAPEFLLANERYAAYLIKKLEFHQQFEGSFEGSYSLEMYFNKLRVEGKKLQIGGSDSPIRRQAVPLLLELESLALNVLDQLLMPSTNQFQDALKLKLSLPLLADLSAMLILFQYITSKLLATKTDFTKAIMQYQEQYNKIRGHFNSFAAAAANFPWFSNVKLPQLPATAPALTKGQSCNSPPSLNFIVSASPSLLPQPLIFETLSDADNAKFTAMWNEWVFPGHPADTSPPLASTKSLPMNAAKGAAPESETKLSSSASIPFPSSGEFQPFPTYQQQQQQHQQHQLFAPSFDPFSGSNGFSQGDPFASIPTTTSAADPFPVDHPNIRPASPVFGFDDSDPFTPSSSHSSPPDTNLPLHASQPISHNHNTLQISPPTPKKRSLSPGIANPRTVQDHLKSHHTHKKQHSADMGSFHSGGFAISNSDGSFQTSEEKLKDKDRLNAQAAEFADIQSTPANSQCFDCGDKAPKWVSINLGVFICYRCAGIHRSFGTHISKVRSIQLDVMTPEQVAVFRAVGNEKAKSVWLANIPDDLTPPDRGASQSALEKWLRDKYVYEEFKAKEPVKRGHQRARSEL